MSKPKKKVPKKKVPIKKVVKKPAKKKVPIKKVVKKPAIKKVVKKPAKKKVPIKKVVKKPAIKKVVKKKVVRKTTAPRRLDRPQLPLNIDRLFKAATKGDNATLKKAMAALSTKRAKELFEALPWDSDPGERMVGKLPKLGKEFAELQEFFKDGRLPPAETLVKCCCEPPCIDEFRELCCCLWDWYRCNCCCCWPCCPPWRCRYCFGRIRVYPKDGNPDSYICASRLYFDGNVTVEEGGSSYQALITVAGGSGMVDHAGSHENGGSDEISVAGLAGLLADPQTPAPHAITAHTGTLNHSALGVVGATDHHSNTNDPSANEKAALAGEGAPSGTNKYTTKSYVDGRPHTKVVSGTKAHTDTTYPGGTGYSVSITVDTGYTLISGLATGCQTNLAGAPTGVVSVQTTVNGSDLRFRVYDSAGNEPDGAGWPANTRVRIDYLAIVAK